MVGIDGDPHQANDAFIAVYSAALAQSGSMDDIQPGIDFFAQLKRRGTLHLHDPVLLTCLKERSPLASCGTIWVWASAISSRANQTSALLSIRCFYCGAIRLHREQDGPSSFRSPPVDGIHLLRRGAVVLSDRLCSSRPLSKTGFYWQDTICPCLEATISRSVHERQVRHLSHQLMASNVVTQNWQSQVLGQ